MGYVIETERLRLREFLLSDAQYLFDLNNDPDVIRYTGDVAFTSVTEATQFLQEYKEYEHNGYGRWACISKQNHDFIGWCGLKMNEENAVDLGFRFFKRYWGQGYATEAASACIKYGFSILHLSEIIGRSDQNNLASIRVLEKIGMQFYKFDNNDHIENAVYYKVCSPKLG